MPIFVHQHISVHQASWEQEYSNFFSHVSNYTFAQVVRQNSWWYAVCIQFSEYVHTYEYLFEQRLECKQYQHTAQITDVLHRFSILYVARNQIIQTNWPYRRLKYSFRIWKNVIPSDSTNSAAFYAPSYIHTSKCASLRARSVNTCYRNLSCTRSTCVCLIGAHLQI